MPHTAPSYFQRHVFFCCNQRDKGEACCNDFAAQAMQNYAKQRIHQAGLSGAGKFRINKAGCLDRCSEGPVLVVYPDNVWYTYVDEQDIDEILEKHVKGGQIVQRLRLPDVPPATTQLA